MTYDTISSVSIGELQVSHNQDTALLDSYQETRYNNFCNYINLYHVLLQQMDG